MIYVGPGQHDNEAAILRNVYGSTRYMSFLAGLGTLVRLRDCPPAEIYTGGLDRNGEDGEFAYSWQDDICQGNGPSQRKSIDKHTEIRCEISAVFKTFSSFGILPTVTVYNIMNKQSSSNVVATVEGLVSDHLEDSKKWSYLELVAYGNELS